MSLVVNMNSAKIIAVNNESKKATYHKGLFIKNFGGMVTLLKLK